MTWSTLAICSTWLERREVWFTVRAAATTTKTKRFCSLLPTFCKSSAKQHEKFRRSSGELHPDVPWAAIVGLRHRVVHDYLHVDLDIVWDVVHQDLGPLIAKLQKIVPD